MEFNITKEIFEQTVPAFRSPSGTSVFSKVEPFLESSANAINSLLDGYEPESDEIRVRSQHLVCLDAAYTAVPELDLILTSTGFGVVNNQNQAPASASRVQALMESLRRQRSNARDLLVYDLRSTTWCQTSRAIDIFRHFLWCPMLVRRYGISLCDHSSDIPTGTHKEVYADEYELMANSLNDAESEVVADIGQELASRLLEMERINLPHAPYTLILEPARRLIACILMQHKYPFAARSARRNLMQALQRNEQYLPEYTGSREYEAHQTRRYENRKEDPTFFFG